MLSAAWPAPRTRAAMLCIAQLVAAGGSAAQPAPPAPPAQPWHAQLRLEQLKAVYLACDRRASTERLQVLDAQQCSVLAEALLQRGFAGDFDRLLGWWRTARHADAALVRVAPE
jgi:hypothetical protein